MKTIIIATFLLASLPLLAREETTIETAAITGNDILNILELDAQKYTINFEEDHYVTLHYEANGQNKNYSLHSLSSQVTLLTYLPSGGAAMKSLRTTFTAKNGESMRCAFPVDTSKIKGEYRGLVNGIYTILAWGDEKSENPIYKIQIKTSDTKP